MKSLMGKLFVFTALMVILSMVILGGGIFPQLRNTVLSERQQSMTRTAKQVGSMTTELLGNYNYIQERNYRFMLENLTDDGRNHILVCDKDGQVLISSDESHGAYLGAVIDPEIVSELWQNGSYNGVGDLGGLYRGTNFTAGEVYRNANGVAAGFVLVTSSVEHVTRIVEEIQSTFYFWMILIVLFIAILAYFISRTLTRPVKRMASAAREFAHGKYTARVPVTTQDEIGELTVAFNNMADAIEKSEELRRGFVANVSHELRSPMTSIAGFVDGIRDGTIPPEQQGKYLDIISSEVRRLSRLVSRMLDITRMQASDPTENGARFDLCEVVRRAVLAFEARLEEKTLVLDVKLPEHGLYLFGNEDALYQVVYNLVDNAVKFSDNERVITLSVSAHGRDAECTVSNFGQTIPPEELPYLFDRFHKTDRSRSEQAGLGLGLYIVKTTVNQHKGDIGVTSENGKTTFWFRIPMTRVSRNEQAGGVNHE